MSYNVSTADVEARWRALSDDEAQVAATFLDDLVTDLDLQRPALATFLASLTGSAVPADVTKGLRLERVIVRTLALAVKRALRNPDTLSSTNIQPAGGIAVGYDNSTDALDATAPTLTAADLRAIDKATVAVGGTAPSSVRSVKMQAYPERYATADLTVLPTP